MVVEGTICIDSCHDNPMVCNNHLSMPNHTWKTDLSGLMSKASVDHNCCIMDVENDNPSCTVVLVFVFVVDLVHCDNLALAHNAIIVMSVPDKKPLFCRLSWIGVKHIHNDTYNDVSHEHSKDDVRVCNDNQSPMTNHMENTVVVHVTVLVNSGCRSPAVGACGEHICIEGKGYGTVQNHPSSPFNVNALHISIKDGVHLSTVQHVCMTEWLWPRISNLQWHQTLDHIHQMGNLESDLVHKYDVSSMSASKYKHMSMGGIAAQIGET